MFFLFFFDNDSVPDLRSDIITCKDNRFLASDKEIDCFFECPLRLQAEMPYRILFFIQKIAILRERIALGRTNFVIITAEPAKNGV